MIIICSGRIVDFQCVCVCVLRHRPHDISSVNVLMRSVEPPGFTGELRNVDWQCVESRHHCYLSSAFGLFVEYPGIIIFFPLFAVVMHQLTYLVRYRCVTLLMLWHSHYLSDCCRPFSVRVHVCRILFIYFIWVWPRVLVASGNAPHLRSGIVVTVAAHSDNTELPWCMDGPKKGFCECFWIYLQNTRSSIMRRSYYQP